MKRIAIVGGGISGLSAAYELARQQQAGASVDFVLFEAASRLGGIVDTERRDGFIIECGPDSWVTEKSWARELAIELGLESEIIYSQDEHRKTYLAENGELRPLPDGMRMMVPYDLATIRDSPFFSAEAKAAYAREPQMAEHLKAFALDDRQPRRDESVRDFVVRHFGADIADSVAAPLLAGVFGGDIRTLSVRAVLPAYVALERKYGSLIVGLEQAQNQPTMPIFSTLRNGLSGLIQGMESQIPRQCIRLESIVQAVERTPKGWQLQVRDKSATSITPEQFDAIIVATPANVTAPLLDPIEPGLSQFLPQDSSSAIVVGLAFTEQQAKSLQIPRGFGFLVPQPDQTATKSIKDERDLPALAQQALLACTFVDQKFLYRAPEGSVLLRAFFGGPSAPALLQESDVTLGNLAHDALEQVLGELPELGFTVVRRWPNSLPLYAVGHPDRIAELESHIARFPNLRLIGNAYRGVGLPDLIRDARNAAREMAAILGGS